MSQSKSANPKIPSFRWSEIEDIRINTPQNTRKHCILYNREAGAPASKYHSLMHSQHSLSAEPLKSSSPGDVKQANVKRKLQLTFYSFLIHAPFICASLPLTIRFIARLRCFLSRCLVKKSGFILSLESCFKYPYHTSGKGLFKLYFSGFRDFVFQLELVFFSSREFPFLTVCLSITNATR